MLTRLLAVSILVLTMGCRGDSGVTEPPTVPSPPLASTITIAADGPTGSAVFPGDVPMPPAVKVLRTPTFQPVPGTRVTFAFSDGTSSSVMTDQEGFARLENWQPDYTKSVDTVIASADGISGAIKFDVVILHKTVAAAYDLRSINGSVVPVKFTDRVVTGGRYVLFDDGTYTYGYLTNGKERLSKPQQYIRRDLYVEFYSSPGLLFTVGTPSAGGMLVSFTDTYDGFEEVYLKH